MDYLHLDRHISAITKVGSCREVMTKLQVLPKLSAIKIILFYDFLCVTYSIIGVHAFGLGQLISDQSQVLVFNYKMVFQVKLELLREKGFTVTHLVCAILIFVPNVLSKTIFFLIYRKFAPALESFYELLSNQLSIVLTKGEFKPREPKIFPVKATEARSDES